MILLSVFIMLALQGWSQTTVTNKGTDITTKGNIYIKGSYVNGPSNLAKIANGGTIFIQDSIVNKSQNHVFITNRGKVVLNGQGQQVIAGDSAIHFHKLEVNKPANEVVLNQNIKVRDSLTLTNGNVFLNGKTIDLDTAGRLAGEKNTSRVYGNTGKLTARKFIDSSRARISNNQAGLGIYISTKAQFGKVDIERGHVQQNYGGDTSIHRYYNFIPVNTLNTGKIDTLKIAYLDDSETIEGESNYKIYSSNDNGIEWRNKGGFVDTANNFVTTTTVSPPEIGRARFSIFATENFATCLPNDPKYISAVFLVSTTVYDGDSTHFVQLTSPDPTAYSWNFGDGTITNAEDSPYHIFQLINADTTQYQVAMTVTNGLCSDTRKKNIKVVPKPALKIGQSLFIGFESINSYPNPTEGYFNLDVVITNDSEISIRVMNMQGKLLEERIVKTTKAREDFDLSNYNSGMYYVQVKVGEEMRVVKMIKL